MNYRTNESVDDIVQNDERFLTKQQLNEFLDNKKNSLKFDFKEFEFDKIYESFYNKAMNDLNYTGKEFIKFFSFPRNNLNEYFQETDPDVNRKFLFIFNLSQKELPNDNKELESNKIIFPKKGNVFYKTKVKFNKLGYFVRFRKISSANEYFLEIFY